jgi:hypothetical protein
MKICWQKGVKDGSNSQGLHKTLKGHHQNLYPEIENKKKPTTLLKGPVLDLINANLRDWHLSQSPERSRDSFSFIYQFISRLFLKT